MSSYTLHTGDIYEWAQSYNGSRFHACLCDPPYHLTQPNIRNAYNPTPGLSSWDAIDEARKQARKGKNKSGFMGKEWDGGDVAFRPDTWAAIGDCLLPGAYLLAFGGTRTWHRLAVAIEDAGFEIRDTVMWVYGSGFPKSHDVSKAIDREAGATREVSDINSTSCPDFPNPCKGHPTANGSLGGGVMRHAIPTSPATPLAKTWDGYGSALKPAWEPIIIARKPLEGTIAQNCVEYGSGAINIDGCRVDASDGVPRFTNRAEPSINCYGDGRNGSNRTGEIDMQTGRFPANLIHDGSEEVLQGFPSPHGAGEKRDGGLSKYGSSMFCGNHAGNGTRFGDSGSSARFFYCAKASKSERDAGCEGMLLERPHPSGNKWATTSMWNGENGDSEWKEKNPNLPRHNHHPTVKPIALTEYLARMILPPAEYAPRRLLVPFAGSGSEMIGAHKAGWDEITGVELTPEYVEIAEARLKHWVSVPRQISMVQE